MRIKKAGFCLGSGGFGVGSSARTIAAPRESGSSNSLAAALMREDNCNALAREAGSVCRSGCAAMEHFR